MSSSLFGGGERPPSPPDTANKPSPPGTDSPTLAAPTPTLDPMGPCTLHLSCRPTQVEIDRRGDLILIVGDDSCALHKVRESGKAEPEQLGEEQQRERELISEPTPEQAPPEEPAPEEPEPEEPEPEVQKPIAFRVCSRTMARAAAPFDAMLYRGFKESIKAEPTKTEPTRLEPTQEGSEWIVRLPDDDPWVMALLLPVIHGCFTEFDPQTLQGATGLQNLYKVTVLTDKYDMTQILRPWASRLVQSLKGSMGQLDSLDLEKALWVSWKLGSKTALKLVVDRLVYMQPKRDFGVLAPPRAEEAIRDSRLEIITALLKPIKDTIEASISQEEIPDHGFRCLITPHPVSNCSRIILGSLMQSLGVMGMWPLPSAKDWIGTSGELHSTLYRNLRIAVLEGQHGHGQCLSMKIRGSNNLVSWFPATKASFEMPKKYAALQAKKMGLTDD